MSRARRILVALLTASTAVFAVGATAERSQPDGHAEPAKAQTRESESGGAHEEGEASSSAESEKARGGGPAADAHAESGEAVLGIDIESTPLILLAVIAGLGLAALAASKLGRLPAVLIGISLIALAWAALDVREVIHQFDDSRIGIAIVAITVAALHLAAAALAGSLSVQALHPDAGTPDRPGAMPA